MAVLHETIHPSAGDGDIGRRRGHRLLEAFPCLPDDRHETLAIVPGELQRRGHADRTGDIGSSGTTAQLLSPTDDRRCQGYPIAHDEDPDTSWPSQFVATRGEKIHSVDRQGPRHRPLDGVGVEGNPRIHRVYRGCDLGDGLYHPGLVVRRHHRHHRGVCGDRRRHPIGVDHTVLIDTHDRYLRAETTAEGRRLEDGLMLHGGHHHAPSSVGGEGASQNGEIVRLGPTRGEHHVAGYGAHVRRHPLPRLLEGVLGPARRGVLSRRVAEDLLSVGRHRGHYLGARRCGGGVVDIDLGHQVQNGMLGGHRHNDGALGSWAPPPPGSLRWR